MAVGLGVAGLVVALGLALALVGAGLVAHARAAAAADAAALAAAPVTFRPFGAAGGPRAEAQRFAARNGARLVACSCPVNRSWDERTVEVVVARRLVLPVVGPVTVHATSRATFEPLLLLEP